MYHPRHKRQVSHARTRTLAAGITVAGIAGGGQLIMPQEASASSVLTPAQVTEAAKEGCPQLSAHALNIAVKLTTPESSRIPDNVGDGGVSLGLWQINTAAHGNPWGNLSDPVTNARAMCDISDGGQNFRPWTTFVNGAYLSAPGATEGGSVPAQRHDEPTVGGPYGRPVPGQVTQPYHNPGSQYQLGYHTGVDLAASLGEPVHSAGPGKVVSINQSGTPYGNHVVVRHPGGVYTLYGHLSVIRATVGEPVTHNTVIGLAGNTGATHVGVHLHFEVRSNPTAFYDGLFRDPIAWLSTHKHSEPVVRQVKARHYTVKSGDWLIRIAREKLGDAGRWQELYDANKDVIGSNPNLITAGQVLQLP